jgi:hypothetical protein
MSGFENTSAKNASRMDQNRLEFLLGVVRASAYLKGEGYLASVRCAMNGDRERYQAQSALALREWIEACRLLVAEADAVTDKSPSGSHRPMGQKKTRKSDNSTE